jgi:hypothetical protein
VVHLDHAVSFSVRLLRALGYQVFSPADAETLSRGGAALGEDR